MSEMTAVVESINPPVPVSTDPAMQRVLATVERANNLFPQNPYMRASLYCHAATLEGRDNPLLSPKIITPMIVGKAGYGKTSIMRQLARESKIGFREVQLAGYTDLAEVFGMIDRVTPDGGGRSKTVLALPDWWPDPETNPEDAEGIIVFDDATRALPHIFQAVMQFVINGEYNGLKLPEGWSCVITSNPADGEHNVLELDPAQSSRMLLMGYNRPKENFIEQCERQDVHDDMKNFWATNPELLEVEAVTVPKPDNNDRTKMIWNRIYPYIKHDLAAFKMVGVTMFGPAFVTTLLSSLESDQPIKPEAVLYHWAEVKEQFKRYTDARRTDLISATTFRVIAWLENQQLTELDDEVFSNMAHFALSLPQADQTNLNSRLCGTSSNRASTLSHRLSIRTDGTVRDDEHVKTYRAKLRDTMVQMRRQLTGA